MKEEQIVIKDSSAVIAFLEYFKIWMDDPDITEVCVNRPYEVFYEKHSTWYRVENVQVLSFNLLRAFCTSVAAFSSNDVSEIRPILSAVLPNGERIQCVLPPTCEKDTISITIRKPSHEIRLMKDYSDQGFFDYVQPVSSELTSDEKDLVELHKNKRLEEFLEKAVQLSKVIVVAGETGSGKTTFMKALMQSIDPTQRIITIEDVPELFLPNHPNHVHLYYKSEAREEEGHVTAATLLKSCLRMKPTRILLAELRGGETYDFINVCVSGHGGSITSCHAGSTEMTFERLALMTLQNRQGRSLPYEVIKKNILLAVDIVVHIHNDVERGKGRHITEIWYDPSSKRHKI